MNLRELLKPNVSEEKAANMIRSIYGLEVTQIKRMDSFNDQNFHLQVSNNHQNPYIDRVSENGYTLKIINTMKSSLEGHFESMHSAMIHLNDRGLRVPVPVKDLKGRTFNLEQVLLLNEGNESPRNLRCGVHLLTFLPGMPITKISPTQDVFFQWGALLAKFHQEAEDLDCPNLKMKRIFYSLEHIPEIRNFMEGLDEEKKKVVIQVLNRYSAKIIANIANIPKGFIHGDFNGHNILVQTGSTELGEHYSVDGILDFEDMHHGTYIWDIGLMLAHSLLDCKGMDPYEAAGHTLAGYLSRRPLSELEMTLIKVCIECRLCQSSVLCLYSCRLDPNNSYVSLLSSSETKWERLEQLLNTRNEDLLKQWNLIHRTHSLNETALQT